jgi:macrolide-specific efflux system membrane fusion protein
VIAIIGIGAWAFFASRPKNATVVERDIVGLVPVSGKVVVPPSAKADVYAPFQSPVEKVHVTVGQKVDRGDVLVELSYVSAEMAVEQARQQVKAAETAYANARNQNSAALRAAQQQLAEARKAEQQAKQPASTTYTPEGGAITVETPAAAESATQARIAAEQAVQQARLDLEANILPFKTQLDQARETYQQARSGARIANIKAPTSGTVLAINVRPGEQIPAEQKEPVATIVDLGELQVHAEMKPEEASGVKPGTDVAIRFADIPNKQFEGKVSRITTQVDSKLAGLVKQQEYVAIVEFTNDEGLVKPDSKVQQVALKTGEAQNVAAVPVEALDRDKSGRPTVKALRNGSWQPVVVEAGITDGTYVEIKSGLRPGETIQVTPNILSAATR